MTNQFTDEQVAREIEVSRSKAVTEAYNIVTGQDESFLPDSTLEALEGLWTDALEAAAGVAPQAKSERESDKECPHTPRDEWRRRGYCHRCTVEAGWTLLSDQEARRELPVQPSSTVDTGKVKAALRKVLDGQEAMHCTRVDEAWRHGTMTQEDFVPVTEDQDAVDELVRAVVEVIGGESRDIAGEIEAERLDTDHDALGADAYINGLRRAEEIARSGRG